jgi:hypothetical protein
VFVKQWQQKCAKKSNFARKEGIVLGAWPVQKGIANIYMTLTFFIELNKNPLGGRKKISHTFRVLVRRITWPSGSFVMDILDTVVVCVHRLR